MNWQNDLRFFEYNDGGCTFLSYQDERKDTKRKDQGCIFSPTLFLRFAKGVRTLCAQTIAPLDATLRAIAWRRKNKAEGGKGAYGRWEGCLGVVRRVLRGYEMPPYHILLFGVTYNIRGDVYYYFLYVRMSGKGTTGPAYFFCAENWLFQFEPL